jgi:TonB family protein
MALPILALSLALFAQPANSPSSQPTPPPSATVPASGPAALPAKPPCRNPDATGKYHVGCGVSSPIVIHPGEPKYPDEADARKLPMGGVIVSFSVDTNGDPVNVHIRNSKVDTVDKADRAAQQAIEDNMLEAVRRYKFKPATFQGKPVPVEMNVEIDIDLF